uniref:Uncharacterized protein n=1 Tax=Cannabis sativa TaxID=3483 RepID=A0A803Q4N2_CANSA
MVKTKNTSHPQQPDEPKDPDEEEGDSKDAEPEDDDGEDSKGIAESWPAPKENPKVVPGKSKKAHDPQKLCFDPPKRKGSQRGRFPIGKTNPRTVEIEEAYSCIKSQENRRGLPGKITLSIYDTSSIPNMET